MLSEQMSRAVSPYSLIKQDLLLYTIKYGVQASHNEEQMQLCLFTIVENLLKCLASDFINVEISLLLFLVHNNSRLVLIIPHIRNLLCIFTVRFLAEYLISFLFMLCNTLPFVSDSTHSVRCVVNTLPWWSDSILL